MVLHNPYGTSYEINKATDLELANAGIDIEKDVIGMPSETLEEAQEKLAAYIAQRRLGRQNI